MSYEGRIAPVGKLKVKRIRTWRTRIKLLKEALTRKDK